jgi:hypothetical protein
MLKAKADVYQAVEQGALVLGQLVDFMLAAYEMDTAEAERLSIWSEQLDNMVKHSRDGLIAEAAKLAKAEQES